MLVSTHLIGILGHRKLYSTTAQLMVIQYGLMISASHMRCNEGLSVTHGVTYRSVISRKREKLFDESTPTNLLQYLGRRSPLSRLQSHHLSNVSVSDSFLKVFSHHHVLPNRAVRVVRVHVALR